MTYKYSSCLVRLCSQYEYISYFGACIEYQLVVQLYSAAEFSMSDIEYNAVQLHYKVQVLQYYTSTRYRYNYIECTRLYFHLVLWAVLQ